MLRTQPPSPKPRKAQKKRKILAIPTETPMVTQLKEVATPQRERGGGSLGLRAYGREQASKHKPTSKGFGNFPK